MTNKPKPPIPDVPLGKEGDVRILSALKENVELLTGVRGGPIVKLPSTATLGDVIIKLNELIDRVNR